MIKNQKRTTSAENDYVLTNVTYTTPTVSTTPTNKTNKDLILTIQKRNFWKEEAQTDKPTATIKIPLSDYVLRTYLEENYYNKVAIDGFIEQYKIKVVVLESKNNLPQSGDSRYADTSYLFLVRHTHTIDSSSQGDYFDEYIWNNDKSDYERIGNTDIDLSPYLKIADFNAWKNNTYTPTITEIQNDITFLQTDKENISNKVTSISDSSTDTQYPSAKLLNTELKKKENTSNKVTSVNDLSTDTQYPSAKLLNTELKKKEDVSNKVTSINDLSTDTQYPSAKLLNTELKTKEDISNKATVISASSTDNEYPTAKAVHSIASTKLDKSDAFSKNYNDLTNKPTIPTKTSDLINDSDFITEHQDISGKEDKSNKVTSISPDSTDTQYPSAKCVYDLIGNISGDAPGITPFSHTHGNITNEGAIGTTANKPLITGTNGVIQAGSFGIDAHTFCEGDDPRLSDARTPKSHTHTKAEISDFPTSMTPKSHSHSLKDLNIYADGQGGTNLIEDTRSFDTPLSNVGTRDGTYQNCTYRRVNNTSGTGYEDIKLNIPAGTFKHGEKYTLSFWAKGTGNIIVYNYGNTNHIKTKPINCTSGGTNSANFAAYHDGNVDFALTSEWKRYFVTWELNPTSDSTNDASVDKMLILRTKPGANVYLAGVMYERGEIPHDWSPNPKDKEKFDYSKVKGTDNTSGYIKVLQIQINERYQDKPITIEIHQRDNIIKDNVSILFQNTNSTDPLLKSILHNGDENLLVYLYKENNGIWSLITNKRYGGTYGEMDVKIDNPNTGISISKLDTHIASLPTSTSNNPLSLAKNVNLNTANYIKSTHSSSTSEWTGVSDTITHLIAGTHIYYKLNQAPTTANVTLNLTLADSSRSPTGAIPVYIGGLRLNNQFPQGSVIGMIYDGNNWIVTNHVPTVTPCTVTYTDGSTRTINFVTR